MTRIRTSILAATTTALLALGSIASSAQTQSEPMLLKVSDRGAFSNAPIYVAVKEGFLEEEGLKVETVVLGGQSDTLTAALINGDIDILPQNPVAFANAVGKVDMKYFLGIQLDDIELVVKADDNTVPNAADAGWESTVRALKGYRLGSATRGSTTFAKLAIMLKDAGYVADTDYTVVVSGIVNQSIAAMQADQVDAFITDSLGARLAEQQGVGKSVLVWATDKPDAYPISIQTSLAARSSSLAEEPEAYERLGRALVKAQGWIMDPANSEAFSTLLQSQYKLSAEAADDQVERTRATGVFDMHLGPDLFNRTIEFLQFGGVTLSGGVPAYEDSVVKLSVDGLYD